MKRESLEILVRPVSCAFAAISCLVGAKLAQGQWIIDAPVLLMAVAVAFLTGLAMVWDSLLDIPRGGPIKGRYHFVLANQGKVLILAFGLLGLASMSINSFFEIVFWESPQRSFDAVSLLMLITTLVFAYPFVLSLIPGLPNFFVAFPFALIIAAGALAQGKTNQSVWWLTLLIFLIIFAREILKDFEDVKVDPGFKRTLPLWNALAARWITASFLALAVLIVWWLSYFIAGFVWQVVAAITSACIVLTVWKLFRREESKSKDWLTVAMFLLVVGVALV